MPESIDLLILGLGNLLCHDDGLVALAVSRLQQKYEVPEGVVALDGGTLGLALLPYLQQARTAILVDAIQADQPPGSFVRLEGEEVPPAVLHRLSVHQIGVADLLDGARWLGRYPDRVVLLGLVPSTIELGFGCSDAVTDALPALVDAVVDEAGRLGFELTPRCGDAPSSTVGCGDLARALGM